MHMHHSSDLSIISIEVNNAFNAVLFGKESSLIEQRCFNIIANIIV